MDDDVWKELSLSDRCYVCRVLVPHGTMDAHICSQLHMTARDIASEALRRLRKQFNPISKTEESDSEDPGLMGTPALSTAEAQANMRTFLVPLVSNVRWPQWRSVPRRSIMLCWRTAPSCQTIAEEGSDLQRVMWTGDDMESADPTTDSDTLVRFCGPCASVVPIVDLADHNGSIDHLFAEKCELVFDERVREYIDEELLEFLVPAPSSGGAMEESRTVKRYECHICNLEIPQIYKEELEKSTRHRGSVALASEVTKRASLEFCTHASKGVRKTFDFGSLEIRGRKMSELRAAYCGIKYFGNRFYFQPTPKTE